MLLGNSELVVFGFRRELVERLIKEQYDVYASFPQSDHGNGYTTAKELGCKFIPIDMDRHSTDFLYELKLIFRIKNLIKRLKPDLVITYTIKPNIYGGWVCEILKIPYIANITGLGKAVENAGVLQAISLFMYKSALEKAEAVYFQNIENMQFFAQKGISSEKNKLVPGSGVNLKKFEYLPYPKSDKVHFLFIARIIREKGIDEYLSAAQIIKKRYPNTEFHILGVCEDEKYLEKMTILENNGVITYEGSQKDIRPFLKMSSCTIHPTFYPEGLSNVLLETAASGRPIITTDRSGCREIVDNNVNGFICKQKNTKDLVRQIKKFLKMSIQEREVMGLNARKKVEAEFDREYVVELYMQEIYRILKKEG